MQRPHSFWPLAKLRLGLLLACQRQNLTGIDSSIHENPFQYKFPKGEIISAVYLIAPEVSDPVPSMNAFVDLAVNKHGVTRFVLLTGSSVEKGGYHTGKVWEQLVDIDVEYCVLRANWFMFVPP